MRFEISRYRELSKQGSDKRIEWLVFVSLSWWPTKLDKSSGVMALGKREFDEIVTVEKMDS